MRKKLLIATLGGFIIGLLWVVVVRFAVYSDEHTHFHANFALYVNGERDEFDNFTFYEEVQSCGSDEVSNPKIRVHMHEQINDAIHVHDDGVTWGHFFANLGYGLTNDALQTDDGVFVDGQDNKELTFIVNGESINTIANRPIANEDVVLISYGDESDDELASRADALPKTAAELNSKPDPSSCSGSDQATFLDRLRYAVGLGN